MADSKLRCPECRTRLKVPANASSVRCPECGTRSRIDDEDERDDEEYERPRRRRDDDDDDDDRPRRRRRRRGREEPQEGPWLIGLGAVVAAFLVTFGGALLVKGTAGLAPGQDGLGGKIFGLGIGFLVSLILVPLGLIGVKNRCAYGKWGMIATGTMGVATGMVQAVAGGLIAGFTLYGLIFTLLNGR